MVHDFMQKNLLFHAFKDQVETKYTDFECVPKTIIYIYITKSKNNPIFT